MQKFISTSLLLVISILISGTYLIWAFNSSKNAGIGSLIFLPLGFFLTPVFIGVSFFIYYFVVRIFHLPKSNPIFYIISGFIITLASNFFFIGMVYIIMRGNFYISQFNPQYAIKESIIPVNYVQTNPEGTPYGYKFEYNYSIQFSNIPKEYLGNTEFTISLTSEKPKDYGSNYKEISGSSDTQIISSEDIVYSGKIPLYFPTYNPRLLPNQKIFIEVYFNNKKDHFFKSIFKDSAINNWAQLESENKQFLIQNQIPAPY